MGLIQHHALVATTDDNGCAPRFRAWAEKHLTEQERKLLVWAPSWANDYESFALLPDGSQEGWPDSDEGDQLRDKVIARLRADGFGWDFVEASFGELGIAVRGWR